jgi:hypothetical protein
MKKVLNHKLLHLRERADPTETKCVSAISLKSFSSVLFKHSIKSDSVLLLNQSLIFK